jgi:hypothetical protein
LISDQIKLVHLNQHYLRHLRNFAEVPFEGSLMDSPTVKITPESACKIEGNSSKARAGTATGKASEGWKDFFAILSHHSQLVLIR